MELCLATGNVDKVLEFEAALAPLGFRIRTQKHWPDFIPAEETGTTLAENALLKARALFKYTGLESVADDTGLLVDALDGAPGVWSARYAGEHASYSDNVRRILISLKTVQGDDRRARFETVIAVVGDWGEFTLKGQCSGCITEEPRGAGQFGYDPIFEAEDTRMTFAQMDLEQKNKISHRGRAIQALVHWLKGR